MAWASEQPRSLAVVCVDTHPDLARGLCEISVGGLEGPWEDRFLLGSSAIAAAVGVMALHSAADADWFSTRAAA